MYKLLLETTDLENPDFAAYLFTHGISAKVITLSAHVLGAGDIIEYTAQERGALVAMVEEYWSCGGDSDCTEEIIGTIEFNG